MYINTYTKMLKTHESNIILFQFKNSPKLHNYFTTTTTFIINSTMAYSTYQFIYNMFSKHQQQQLLMNSFQVHPNHNFIIHHFSQKHNIFIHMICDTWIQYQQHLIIQFICTNISSTIRHEFIHQISHKHLFSKSLNWIITYEKG